MRKLMRRHGIFDVICKSKAKIPGRSCAGAAGGLHAAQRGVLPAARPVARRPALARIAPPILLAAGLLAGLSGCGGGGTDGAGSAGATVSSGSAVDPGPTVSLLAAQAFLSQHGENRAFAISGSRTDPAAPGGTAPVVLTGSGVLSTSTAMPSLFDGAPVLKSTQVISGTVLANGQATPIDVTTVRFADPDSLAPVARIDNGVTTRFAASRWPTAVRVGSSGVLGTGSNDDLPVGVTTTSYAIGRDTATSVLLTVVETVSVAGVPVTDVRTVTRIHLDGSTELVSITTERFNLGRLVDTLTLSFA